MKKKRKTNKRRLFCLVILIVLLGVWVGKVSAVDPRMAPIPSLIYPGEQNAKAFIVRLLFKSERNVALTSVKVVQGPARSLVGEPHQLRLDYREIGKAKVYYSGYPYYYRTYENTGPRDEFDIGQGHQHDTQKVLNATARLILPFSTKADLLQVSDVGSQENPVPLITIDLRNAIREYCGKTTDLKRCGNLTFLPREVGWLYAAIY